MSRSSAPDATIRMGHAKPRQADNTQEEFMAYFVTGASGFIGKRLVKKLLERRGAVVYFLMREKGAPKKIKALHAYWGVDDTHAVPVMGDLTSPLLGVSKADQKTLNGKIK